MRGLLRHPASHLVGSLSHHVSQAATHAGRKRMRERTFGRGLSHCSGS